MKKMNESGLGTTTNLQAGNTSVTGTNVLDRTILNTPPGEQKIRGTIEGLENYRKHNLAIVPFEILKSVLEAHGVEFVDETGQAV